MVDIWAFRDISRERLGRAKPTLEANGHDLETAVEMILRSSLTSTSRAEAPRVCRRHRCYN